MAGRRAGSTAVAAVWAVLTLFVLAFALPAVLPSLPGDGVPFSERTLLLLGALGAFALAVGRWTDRWFLSLAGFLLVGWGAWSVHPGGCPGVACSVPAGYERWRHVRAFFAWTSTGPGLALASDPVTCPQYCPYTLGLLPLAAGYALFGWVAAGGRGAGTAVRSTLGS